MSFQPRALTALFAHPECTTGTCAVLLALLAHTHPDRRIDAEIEDITTFVKIGPAGVLNALRVLEAVGLVRRDAGELVIAASLIG